MLTVADMMAHMATQLDSALGGMLEGKVRTAVLAGWSRLMSMHNWVYFHRMGTQLVYASQTDGTVDFDVAAKTVTLTGATWPSDVVSKHIRLNNDWFPILRRNSDTVITLWDGKHPPSNLDDVQYILQQVLYPLPYEVGEIVQVMEGVTNSTVHRLSLLEAHQLMEGVAWSPVVPSRFALVADSMNPNRWNLWVPTPLVSDSVLQYMYVARRPRNILVREMRGTVTVSAGVATFSEPVVSGLWDSALIRFSVDGLNRPTGELGDIPAADLTYNRDCTEARVISHTSSTACRISDTSLTATDVVYTASSLIDVCDGPMQVLLQRLVEDEFGVRMVGGHTERLVSKNRLAEAFNNARQADSRYAHGNANVRAWYDLRLQDIGYVSASSYGA